jgi:hypothetical protein
LRTLKNGNVALAVFLDIKGAFDNLISTTIAQGMLDHNIDKDIVGWIMNYVGHRYCKIKRSNQFFRLSTGTGQGEILSPSLWNFVMDSFLTKFNDSILGAIAYTDDGAIVFAYNNIGFAKRQMQTALNDSDQWANDVGLQFSPAKTKAMIFSRKRTETNLPEPLQISGVEVELVEKFKYLGVIMDSCLGWTPHINYIAKKAKRHLIMLYADWAPHGDPPRPSLFGYTQALYDQL